MEAHSDTTNQMNMNETFSDAVETATAREIAPGHAGFTMNADGTTTRHSANGQTSTPVNATVSITDTTTSSAQALDFLPVLPAKPTSSAAIFTAFEVLAQARLNWEANQQRASNDVLYAILDRCYDIFDLTQKSDTLREKFLKAYDAKYGKCKASTSVATKIVWAVFGKQLEQRAFNYSNVLRNVYLNLKAKPGKTFREYVVEAGGLDEIRRTGGNTDAVKAKRDAERQTAIADLSSNSGFAKGLQIQLPAEQQEKNAEHSFRAALIREDADGTFTIVMVSSSEVPVNSMISEFSKRDDIKPAPSASGTAEALDELDQLIAANVNA